ncbi:MAG: 4a-hydroxytetrahydrobiopterin dehydratase [Melioribacteraceae bacterium]|nr:4a-hydroxytetrahydrobiopterin dehydratase [Melioribacteraceae bacterium]
MALSKASEIEIELFLEKHTKWSIKKDKLSREFEFNDFVQAFGFMAQAAIIAESLDHHPDWSNSYNKVKVELATHDAGGITSLDFNLASKMDSIAKG